MLSIIGVRFDLFKNKSNLTPDYEMTTCLVCKKSASQFPLAGYEQLVMTNRDYVIKLNQYKDLETIGHVVSRLWCLNMFPEALDLYYAYNEIKREDIAAFIDKYFKGKHWVAGILINKAKSNSFGYEKLLQP